MTLAEAISSFVRFARQKESAIEGQAGSTSHTNSPVESLELLTKYFSPTDAIESISPDRLRDFLARWCIERSNSISAPELHSLLDSLLRFFSWISEYRYATAAGECLTVIKKLEQSIPLALEITEKLSKHIANRGGAFAFPEFLTSFESGGRSQYDFDAPGELGSIEGYFLITRIEGSSVEAIDTISEERVWSIIFPADVASLLRPGFIINLELVISSEGWQIAACGFAYPPGATL